MSIGLHDNILECINEREQGSCYSTVEKYFEEYMTRSLQIRSLSMPPERLDENASHFYQQFNDNFMRIKALILENREVLDTRVYRLLKKYPDISEQDADKLIEFPTPWPTRARWKWWTCSWRG